MESYVLITGASSGVGKELAIYLSQECSVILNGRDELRLEETKNACNPNNDVLIWRFDLENISNLENDLKKWINEKKISICGFVHCAGMMKMVPCKSFSEDFFEKVYRVNVFSAALIMKILSSKRVNQSNLRSAVFISSNISNRGAKTFGIYGSSKAALDGLMRNLAVELAPATRVNSVLPGGMITSMTEDLFENEEMRNNFEKNYPLGIGTPKKLAPLVEFLLSEKSDWITGQQFVIDGGRTTDITEKTP